MILLSTGHRGMKFFIKGFFIKCEQICNFLRIWSHLLQKALMENFIFVFALRLVSKKGGGDYLAGENLQKIIKYMINSKSRISIISWNNALLSLMLNLKRYKHINLIPYLLHKKSLMVFFIKCDQTRRFLQTWWYLLNKSLMENFPFCAVIFMILWPSLHMAN